MHCEITPSVHDNFTDIAFVSVMDPLVFAQLRLGGEQAFALRAWHQFGGGPVHGTVLLQQGVLVEHGITFIALISSAVGALDMPL